MIVLSLFNFVNEVTSRKLPIDRIKVAQKLGALKDISLFGSFEFPSSGSNSGGLVACSLAGIGKELKKKKAAQKYSQSCTSNTGMRYRTVPLFYLSELTWINLTRTMILSDDYLKLVGTA